MYNVFMVAYPTNSSLEEKLHEFVINNSTDQDTYACVLSEIEMDNVPEGLTECVKNGFKTKEATENV